MERLLGVRIAAPDGEGRGLRGCRGFRESAVGLRLLPCWSGQPPWWRARPVPGSLCGPQHQPPSASPAGVVQVKTFSPYAATGTLVVPVADHLSGSCWTGSIAVPVAGVYRCLAGDQIYDPCFAPSGADQPADGCLRPGSRGRRSALITLTAPLPPASPPAQGRDSVGARTGQQRAVCRGHRHRGERGRGRPATTCAGRATPAMPAMPVTGLRSSRTTAPGSSSTTDPSPAPRWRTVAVVTMWRA